MSIFSIILLILLSYGCNFFTINQSQNDESTYYVLEQSKDSLNIHFQSGFDNDSIIIEINNKQKIIKQISTDPSLGFAFDKKYSTNDIYLLKIKLLKNNYKYEIIIDSLESNYLAIWYNSKIGLLYEFSGIPFKYE